MYRYRLVRNEWDNSKQSVIVKKTMTGLKEFRFYTDAADEAIDRVDETNVYGYYEIIDESSEPVKSVDYKVSFLDDEGYSFTYVIPACSDEEILEYCKCRKWNIYCIDKIIEERIFSSF